MDPIELHWKSGDGLNLFAQDWRPTDQTNGVLCLVHGLGEHIGRYEHVAKFMTSQGYALVGADLRGHGKSDGKRGHAPSYDALFDDIKIMLDYADSHYPGVPRYLYGHSLGANLVLCYALRRPTDVQGIIATGPILRPAFDPPAWKISLGKALYSLWPSFTMTNELDTNALSRDPSVVAAYIADPLVHDRISTRLAMDMLDSGEWLLDHAGEFSLPLLMIHGEKDRLTSPLDSQSFAAQVKKGESLILWDDCYHEVHNEPCKFEVLGAMVEWMKKQSPERAQSAETAN